MRKRLTKTGNSLALALDRPLLEATGIDAATTLEVSTNGDVIVVTPVRPKKRTAKLDSALEARGRRFGSPWPAPDTIGGRRAISTISTSRPTISTDIHRKARGE
jgi:antitoxin component of MazEF toxin-antitoxin module